MAATQAALETVLGRPEEPLDMTQALASLRGQRVLVTGAAGSLGERLCRVLRDEGITVSETDIVGDMPRLDVTNTSNVYTRMLLDDPDVVFHLAGAKHAGAGEEDPWNAALVNLVGTAHVLRWSPGKVVLASTCKACDPETAYGATKLVAERLTLNKGGVVARFFNVVETSGNVFEIWRGIPEGDVIPYTACSRFFMSADEAVSLLLVAGVMGRGRYAFDPGERRSMRYIAEALYPDRVLHQMDRRRGDRSVEPRNALHERWTLNGRLAMVTSPHDPS